jgi:hypothetical protein
MGRVYGNHELAWKDDALFLRGSRTPILCVVPDPKYPAMWRVEYPDGRLSDMVNRTRAKDAARSIALQALNRPAREAAE